MKQEKIKDSMTPERWQQIMEVFDAALERQPPERAAYLAQVCANDMALRQELESLLSAHEQAGSFISHSALGAEIGSSDPMQPSDVVEGNGNLTGQSLEHYQLVEKLGEGGMGVVYKAQDSRLRRSIAIKVLSPESVADPERKRRFVQEARAASGLNHPNIITIHDIGQAEGVDFIAMEYVDGKTLDRLIPRKGMRVAEALKYAIQIADALAAAHAAGIIHRDLKPGNVMVTEKGQVKVLDFGLAKLMERARSDEGEQTKSQTEEGMILGTVLYMSPEQAEGRRLDARSDIFSFGSVLYEMLTGQKPFQGDSRISTLSAILNKDPKPASEIRLDIPRDLEKIISRCVRKEPERRFQTMADLKVGLEEVKEELAPRSPRVTEDETSLAKRKHVFSFIGLGVLAAVIAVGAGMWIWMGNSNTGRPESVLTPVPLTTYPGYEFAPSFSPDGSQVAFVWSKTAEDESGADIYVKQIGVEEPYRLTDNPAAEDSPAWSPDGRSIAFARWPGTHIEWGSPTQRITYLVKPQRGGPERTVAEFEISSFASAASMCDWMPDSKSLIVVGKNAPEEPDALFIVSLETGERRRVTTPPPGFGDLKPAVSPDGRTLVFSRHLQMTRTNLYRLDLSEKVSSQREPERLTFENLWNYCAAWIAHQPEIVFISGPDTARYLCRMSPFTPAKIQQLAFAGDNVQTPAVSRQGNRLAYAVMQEDSNIWRVEVRDGKPKVAVKFIASTRGEMEPAYSPDGRKIAFASRRSGFLEIWVCDSDGSHPVQLTAFKSDTNRPRWSPDGELITFWSEAKSNRDVYVVRVDGGVPRQLTTDPAIDSNPNWSADGKWIYFNSDRSGQQLIWKVRASGGEAVRVPEISDQSGQAVESLDGKFLYYDGDGGGPLNNYAFWRVPIDGGKKTLVVDSLQPEGGQVVVDEGIYFISKPDEKSVSYIRFKDFATGSTRKIAPIKGGVSWGLAVSPDRCTILYSQGDESGSDLMLVENFH